jgi:CHAT domain-containing protein
LNTTQASKETIAAEKDGAEVIHFATHGFVDPIDPFQSALLLSNQEVAPLWWLVKQSISPKLLVLSACRTAYAGPVFTHRAIPAFYTIDDSLASIAEFLRIPYVIATLSPVSDRTSRDLMLEFYGKLVSKNGGDPIVALYEAKKTQLHNNNLIDNAAATVASFRVIVPSVQDILQ